MSKFCATILTLCLLLTTLSACAPEKELTIEKSSSNFVVKTETKTQNIYEITYEGQTYRVEVEKARDDMLDYTDEDFFTYIQDLLDSGMTTSRDEEDEEDGEFHLVKEYSSVEENSEEASA